MKTFLIFNEPSHLKIAFGFIKNQLDLDKNEEDFLTKEEAFLRKRRKEN